MKTLIIVLVMVVCATQVQAEINCPVYEYAEIQTMTDSELEKVMTETKQSWAYNIERCQDLLKSKVMSLELRKSKEAMDVCGQQTRRLHSILSKRFTQ